MDDMKQPGNKLRGYVLGEGQHIDDVIAMQAELLKNAGVDPVWRGFASQHERADQSPAKRRSQIGRNDRKK